VCTLLQSGGSIGIWQKYFGTGLTMYGMDINPYCKVGAPGPIILILMQPAARNPPCSRSARTTATYLSCDLFCQPCASVMCITRDHSNCCVWDGNWNVSSKDSCLIAPLGTHNRSCLRTRRG
jgi:hypothetical protein